MSHTALANPFQYYWDVDGVAFRNRLDGTNLGGTGTWDLSSFVWWDGNYRDQAWPDLGPDSPLHAYFGGTSGNVTLGTGISTGGLTFDSISGGGYAITGGTLTFDNDFGLGMLVKKGSGTDAINSNIALIDNLSIDVQDGILALTGVISGTGVGFEKNGDGTLILRGTNTFTGDNTLNGGMTLLLPFANDGAVLGTTAGRTIVNAGATLAFGPDALGSGAIGNPAEPTTLSGDGFRNNGALRFIMGANSMTFNGPITLDGNTRVQSDATGTFTLSGVVTTNDHDLRAGGAYGFVSFTNTVGGTGTITHYGINGFRMQSTAAGQTFAGAIVSELGEVRADVSNTTTGFNPYDQVTSFSIKDGIFQLLTPGGAPVVQNLIDDDIPINLSAARIRLANGTNNAFNEVLGDVAITTGDAFIDFGPTTVGNRQITLSSFTRSPGTTLRISGDTGPALIIGTGTGTNRYQINNTALDGGGLNQFVGGWAYGYGTSTTQTEFLKYNSTTGGFGYTAMVNSDYTLDTAEGTWAAGQNIKITNSNRNITANTTIQTLNLASTTARNLSGNTGTTLIVESGGVITTGNTTHTISVPFLTAGAGSNYELYLIGTNSSTITSDVTDNGGNAVSVIKTGGGTVSFLTANTYTGTTYINEGQFRGVIGSKAVALGGGNLTFGGSSINQSTYENDADFTRPLGPGAGQVQLLSGTGSGFSAFGAAIDINFGGGGATVTWGSTYFNPGIFTLNGGNATHAVTLVNNLDLGGEQRYIRLDGSGSGTERAVIGIIAGDLSNGGVVKRGGGTLIFDNAKTYEGGTIVQQGALWLRGAGTAGANVIGNDIMVGTDGYLRIESPDNIGSKQMIIMQNFDVNTPAVVSFGAGYGTGSEIVFNSLTATGGTLGTGGNNILIANDQSGQARRIAVTLSGNNNFQNDVLGQILAVAPNVEAWFGADSANGIFTGPTLSPSGGVVPAYRLGGHTNTGGVLTIFNADVLTDIALGTPTPLIIGAPDQTDRNYTDGTIYIPRSQSYSGQLTIGSGGILQVGENGALGTGTADINLRAGELRIDVQGGNFGGAVGSQYSARNVDVRGGTGTIRTTTLGGGGFNTVELGDLTFGDANRILQILSIGTNFTDLAVNNVNLFSSTNTAFFNVGIDNSFQSGAGTLTVNGIIGDQVTGLQSIQKNNGGVLVLNGANTYDGSTIVNQGRLVLSNTSAASTGTISMAAAGARTAGLEYRINGAGPFIFNNPLTTSGGDANSTRIITVGPTGPGSEDRLVSIPSLTINNAGGYTVGAGGSSAIFFDGFNGYGLEVSGDVTLTSSINLRTRGAVTTFNGVVSGAGALEKHEQGTLILNGANTYTGTTTVSNGYLIAGDNAALGNAGSDIIFRNNVFSQILASGVRTIGRNFINTATGDIQTLGGLDGGAKLFGGNVNLSTRGIALTSFTGGDTTFSGVISGGFGVDKQGNGTVILDPASGTGNTYTGTTMVTQGILIGQAQATSGSPFGTGAMTVLDAEVRLRGQAGATTSTSNAGALTVAGGARVGVFDQSAAAFSTTLNFSSLVRGGAAGTVTFVPGTGSLGTMENFTFGAALPNANGIVGPWAVHTTSGSNNAANFITGGATSVSTYVYGGSLGSIDTVTGPTQVFDASGTGGTLTANRGVFAFRTDTNIDLGGFRLAVGDSTTPANGGGIILNNGADIDGGAGSRINIENAPLSIYVDDAAVSSLNVPIRNFRSNATNTLTTVLTKFGAGTLEIGAVQQFEGNIELNRGTLSFTAENLLPFFSNLAGTSGSVLFMSPGTTVKLNNFNQEVGNLSALNSSNSFQFSAGTIDLGTARLTVGREDSNQTFNGQILGGTGSTFQKVGTGRLILDNINGNKPSTVQSVMVDRGVLQTWLNDNSWATPTTNTSAIPSTATVYLRGGEWEAYAIGDSTTNQQRINIGNNVVHQGGDSIMDSNRATGGGGNKLLVYNDLTLDVQRFLFTGGNSFIPRFDGTITLANHARVQNDTQAVFAGTITDNGKGYTLNKIGGSDLSIAGDSSLTWNGGMVITGGTLLFGTRGLDDIRSPGVTLVPLATSNAGTGDIIVNQGSAIRITAPSNILTAQGQEVRIYGFTGGTTTRVDVLTDAPITEYGLRSLTDGSIALGLSEGLWTTPINLARFGSGDWGLSAVSNTFYTAPTLGPTLDGTYLFTGTNAATLTITNSGVLTGDNSVEVGKPTVFQGSNPGNSAAVIRVYGDQNYTGNTTVFRSADAGSLGSFLELTGDSTSPVFDVYGRLTLRGAGRLTNDAGVQINTLNLRPGGNLRLDYNMDVNDSFVTSRLNESNLGLEATENKLGDTTPLILDSAGINLISSSSRVNQETVGAITVKGGAGITLERSGSGQVVLQTPGITRDGQATLAIRNTVVAELGSINIQSQKLIVTGPAPVLTNGIVAPWMVNLSGRNFLGYDANLGFTNAPFEPGTVTLGGGNAYLGTFIGTEIVQFPGGWGDTTITGTKNVYALRVDEESATNDMIFTGGQINIHSGGLILGSDDSNRVSFNTTNVYFGDGTAPVEGIVYGGHSTPNSHFGGVVTANNLTFDGPGGFHLTNTGNAISGTIQLNGGRLFLDGAGTRGSATNIILYSDYANNFNGNQMADLRLRHNSATTTFNLDVTVAANVPYAQIQTERFSGTATTTAVQFNNLNILGTDGPAGTLIRMNNSNSNTDVLGTTTIGGGSAVGMNVSGNTWRLVGNVTSAAPILKTGDGALRFDGDNSGFTGGFTLNRGEWRLTAAAAANFDVAGTGDIELNFGAVRMAQNGVSSVFTAAGQDISVNGQVTFITDRNGGATGATRTIGVNNDGTVFRTTNSPYLIFQAASFGDDMILEKRLEINDSPVFRIDSTDLFLRDIVSGEGTFNKAGIWYLHFDNNAANTWSGGFNNFTGVTVVRQVNATLGTGPVQVFAGSALSIASTAQLGTTGLTNIFTSATALPVIGTRTIANFNSITAATAAAIRGTGNGVLSIDANQSLAVDPLMATRDGGVFNLWNLGGGEGNGNLTANSVTPWGVGGEEFRLGGGFSTLTVGPATANSDQFAGVGNKMILGVAHTVAGFGTVAFNANGNNSYGGGTLVTRSRNLDGTFRAAALSLQGGAIGTTTTFRTPLGTGQVDVFGEVRIEGASGTAVTTGGVTNANTWVLHSGSRLRFDNTTAFTGSGTTGTQAGGTIGGGGRWADAVGITLTSAVLDMVGRASDHAANREIVGDITYAGGSEVVVRRATGFGAELITSDLIRSGSGTLMLRHDADLLGDAGSVNTNRFIVNAWSGGSPIQSNNMVSPWIVGRSQNQFLKYNTTLGFQIITEGTTPANYLTSVGGTINGTTLPLNDGTEILNLITATGTLGINPDIHALRTDRSINTSLDSAFSRITIRSGGIIAAANSITINPDLYFGAAGDGTGEALFWANTGAFVINGKINASEVIKSGTNFLSIQSDQPQFTGDWIINGGGLQFQTPGAQSTGEVILNGAHMADNDSVFNLNEVRYNFNSGTPDLFTWAGGKITVNDLGIIRSIAAADRLDQIPAIDLKATGGGHEGIVFFQSDAARHTIRTGTVTLHDHYMLSVDATSFGPGSTSGVQLGAGNGAGGLNNQGLYDVRLTGDGVLSLGDNSASLTGNRTFSVGDGTVRALHNGAFGANTITATLRSTGALEIATSNFVPTATLVQEPGSIERWAVGDARGTGNYSLASGVHLQLFTDVTGTRTIDLAGGSIMGYLPLDYDEVAVIQTIRSGVTVNLTANSSLGQIYPAGISNGANHFMYDMGKLNTSTNLNPSDVGLRGSYLVIDGDITGDFTLTKLGQDVIKLAGNNTFFGLNIDGGIIQLGRNNALSSRVDVVLRGNGADGILDLNGYDQEIGSLAGSSGSVDNSAFDFNTLTVDQSADSIFGGGLRGSVNLTKRGPGILELTGSNTHRGFTTLSEGMLRLHGHPGSNSTLATNGKDDDEEDVLIDGGTLEIAADEQIGDKAIISMSFGALNYGSASGLVETVAGFRNSGGDFSTGANTFLGAGRAIAFAGGTNTVGDGGLVRDTRVIIGGGLNTVEGGVNGGVLHVASGGGLEFGGTDSPTLVLGSNNGVAGRLLLDGDVTVNESLTSGTAAILSSGSGANAGRVDLNGANRTFTIANGSSGNDLLVSAVITNGAIRKEGEGTLRLTGDNIHTGATVINAGSVSIEQESNLGANPISDNAAQLQIDGGTLLTTATFAIDDANRGITLGVNGGTFDTADGTVLTIANVISGELGDLSKTGAGTLVLTAANTYSSPTNGPEVNHGTFLESGILLVNNTTGSGTGDGDVLVAGGSLGGHGSIGGNVRMAPDAGATITASFNGVDDRTLAIGGDLSMTTGNTWLVDLVQNIDGASSRIDIGGTFTLMANTNLEIDFNGAFTADNVYTIAQYGSISGRFSYAGSIWADDTDLAMGGGIYRINYDDLGNTITLTAVPEPGTWLAMILVVAFGLHLHLRRRRPHPLQSAT